MATYNYTPAAEASLFKGRFGGFVDIQAKRFEIGSMEPLTAVLVGVVHFGERFDLDSAAGLILVVTAVIIVILQTNHTPQTPPANIPPTQPQE